MNPVPTSPSPQEVEPLTGAESHLGRALALIHRVLPRLEDPDRHEAVQSALERAAAEIAAARAAHQSEAAARQSEAIDSGLLAIIAAAVAVTVGRPHRVLGIQSATPSTAWVNAWAIEGRFQHYSSHKVR